jgi:hypothetical protein
MRSALAFALVLLLCSAGMARGETPAEQSIEACTNETDLGNQDQQLNDKIQDFNRRINAETDDTLKSSLRIQQSEVISQEAQISSQKNIAHNKCAAAQSQQNTCNDPSQRNPSLWKFNPDTGKCEAKDAQSNPNTGECNDAELLRGTNLKGEACKNTASTIKDVKSQQESLTTTTQAMATGYSSMQASGATGQQSDAQIRQNNILRAMAISKLATGGLALMGATQLKSAAGDAEDASNSITGAAKAIDQACQTPHMDNGVRLSDEQCFYQEARNKGYAATTQDYLNYTRMKSAASQSQDEADQANAMAKASMISGLADTLTGIQAMQLAQQANTNALGLGVVPGAVPPPAYALTGASQGGFLPGAVQGGASASPTDFGNPSAGGLTMGIGGGAPSNNIKKAYPFAPSSYTPARSSVSMAGGGGGGGGGGSSGGTGASSSGPRGRVQTNASLGDFSLAGPGAGGAGGAAAGKEKQDGGSNAFADALAKLFPQDQNGKPVVSERNLASLGEPQMIPQDDEGSQVVASELSIFQQVTAKYHELTDNGSI